jgi:hypothetical protein
VTVNLINKEPTMSKNTNTDKNVIHIIEHNNAFADSIHNIKTSYASLRKSKKQKQILDETWNNKCKECGKPAHIKITQSNDNSNQGKLFGHCYECDLFLGFITDSFFQKTELEYEKNGYRNSPSPRRARSPPQADPSQSYRARSPLCKYRTCSPPKDYAPIRHHSPPPYPRSQERREREWKDEKERRWREE